MLPRLVALFSFFLLTLRVGAFTVVLDAGHGGKDYGTIGSYLKEKDINLDVALRVGKILSKELKGSKIVYTRDDDTFIPLQGRCDIANRAKGDIFVSIHTNSVDLKSPNRSTVSGASVYTLGLRRSDTNLDVAMRENSVIKLENDYTTTYCGFDPSSAESYIIFEMSRNAHMDQSIRLANQIQNELCSTAARRNQGVRQEPFWVLVRTSMPAVLVELDFICNPEIENFLASDEGRDSLARAIANGVMRYQGTMPPLSPPKVEKTAKQERLEQQEKRQEAQKADDTLYYKVQFMTAPRVLDKRDSRLKDIDDVDHYNDGGTIKYTSGRFTSMDDAKKHLTKIKKTYPDAFIIKMQNGQRVR